MRSQRIELIMEQMELIHANNNLSFEKKMRHIEKLESWLLAASSEGSGQVSIDEVNLSVG